MMNSKIKVDLYSQMPVYKQLIQSVQDLVSRGKYIDGDFLPSMKKLSAELGISKETVKKAYSLLREKEIIESAHGKGFFVKHKKKKRSILLLFDKTSAYMQVLIDSFVAEIGSEAEITIRLHNQDITLFEHLVEENLDKFDYYLVTPHFAMQSDVQKKVIALLKRIPNRKLILMDRYLDELPGNYGCVYQDFYNDVFDGLTQGHHLFKKFTKLNVVSMSGCLYDSMIENGIRRFCEEKDIALEIHKCINPDMIQKREVFLIISNQPASELVDLVRTAKIKKIKIGKDIGIISYNESPVNEIILDGLTVISTDFRQMGELAAKMILDKKLTKIRCDFRLIRRSTF